MSPKSPTKLVRLPRTCAARSASVSRAFTCASPPGSNSSNRRFYVEMALVLQRRRFQPHLDGNATMLFQRVRKAWFLIRRDLAPRCRVIILFIIFINYLIYPAGVSAWLFLVVIGTTSNLSFMRVHHGTHFSPLFTGGERHHARTGDAAAACR